MKKIISIIVVIVLLFSFSTVSLAADAPSVESVRAFSAVKASGVDMQGTWSSGSDAENNALGILYGSCYFRKPSEDANYKVGASIPIEVQVNNRTGRYGTLGVFDSNNKLMATASFGKMPSASSVAKIAIPTKGFKTGKYTIWFFVMNSPNAGTYLDTCDVSFSLSSATSAPMPKPAAPASRNAVAANYSTVKISWSKVSGVSGYQVYRSTTGKMGSYQKLKTIASGSTLSMNDKGLKTGQKYYYQVRSYKTYSGTNVFSNFTGTISATPQPGKIVTIRGAASVRSVKLVWSRVLGANGYEIWMSKTSPVSSYMRVKTIASGSVSTYMQTGLTTGKTCYYKLRAYRLVDGKKVYGGFSGPVKVTVR